MAWLTARASTNSRSLKPIEIDHDRAAQDFGPCRERVTSRRFGPRGKRRATVQGGRGRRAAGQDELLERRQRPIEAVDGLLQRRNLLSPDHAVPWAAGSGVASSAPSANSSLWICAMQRVDASGSARRRAQPKHAVQLVDRAIGLDAGSSLPTRGPPNKPVPPSSPVFV